MNTPRPAAVAGLFYPAAAERLREEVDALMRAASGPVPTGHDLRALIVPHAGYRYSGSTAARAYATLAAASRPYRRVALFGPAHRVPVSGLAMSSARAFRTPLGEVQQDEILCRALARHPAAAVSNLAHRDEHALEVQLPFLQCLDPSLAFAAVLVGAQPADDVAATMAPLWHDDECLIIVSTDLSHFHNQDEAHRIDSATDAMILAAEATTLGADQACGYRALNGLLLLAHQRGARIERLALTSSAAATGDRSRVVGYASYALYAGAR